MKFKLWSFHLQLCRRPFSSHHKFGTCRTAQLDLVTSDAQRSTIYALSTPPGKAGVAVIRVSGPNALLVWRSMVRPGNKASFIPEYRKLERCRIVHPENDKEELDNGLAVFFKAPKSFTTEDVVEFHLHSGRAVISSVLRALSRLHFCRPAETGEFIRRAFLGGRLDLTQVEGLKDLIDAETESQRRIAMQAAKGTVRAQFDDLRSRIISCLASVEALIDFGEGEDLEEGVYEQARFQAEKLLAQIRLVLQDSQRGEIIRSGIRLAIFGPPNAGKSSLLNFLAQREAAIVTPIPGTTRDIIELSLDIGDLPVIVIDTAGIRETDDLVENIGVERARRATEAADISLCVLSLSDAYVDTPAGPRIQLSPILQSLITPKTLFLLNKVDLQPSSKIRHPFSFGPASFWKASITTGEGMVQFTSGLAETIRNRFNQHGNIDTPLITRTRHRAHLESACRFLEAFLQTSATDIVLGAEELRYAAQAVGKISGLIDAEDILDVVFKGFCIGK